MKRLYSAVKETFDENGFDDRAKFVAASLIENLRAADSQMKHRLSAIVLAVCVLVLALFSSVKKLSFFGVDLEDTAPLFQALPVAISYFYLSYIQIMMIQNVLQRALDPVVARTMRHLWSGDIEFCLRPVYDMRVYGLLNAINEDRVSSILLSQAYVILLPMLVSIPVIAMVGEFFLFRRFGVTIANVVSVLLCASFLVEAGLLLYANRDKQKISGNSQGDSER